MRKGWASFWRKYMRLTRAGIPVLRALDICRAEETDASRREDIAALLEHVEAGDSVAEAIDRRPEVFSRSVRELVRAAERRGAWDEVLPEIADGLDEGTFG